MLESQAVGLSEKMPEIGHGVASWNVAGIQGEVVVVFQPDYGSWKTVDALISSRVDHGVVRQSGQDVSVLVHERRLVVLEHKEDSGLELFSGDVERDDDLVHLVEDVAGAAGGEDDGRNIVVVAARWWRRGGVCRVLDHADR